MAVTLTKVGKTPGQTQFGLDTFTEHYKCDATADVVLTDTSVPQKGSAHPSYAFMFLTDRYCSETGEKASALDLVYTGCLASSGGLPVLPPSKHSLDNPVQSATTYTSSTIFPAVATLPAHMEYRAHASTLVILSTASTSAAVCPDPGAITTDDIITWSLVATQPASTFGGIMSWLLTNAFVQRIIETTSAEEIVAGQYWQITKRKIMSLYPYAPP
jgi:hypothetical protein